MAATYEIRATSLKGGLRKAHGQAGSVAFQARRRIMQETIYDRPQTKGPPPTRKLTGLLRRSEKLTISGPSVILTNTAKYANIRHNMSGISKLYGHLKDSFWAKRAQVETAPQRTRIFRDALRDVWSKKL